mmetsp:Transcript_85206/g.260443  ORF Transcript_85206/g.260443 Transcript_85206/m.260443 type:complete len:346 (-) Transcript_85206:842-1879(-)
MRGRAGGGHSFFQNEITPLLRGEPWKRLQAVPHLGGVPTEARLHFHHAVDQCGRRRDERLQLWPALRLEEDARQRGVLERVAEHLPNAGVVNASPKSPSPRPPRQQGGQVSLKEVCPAEQFQQHDAQAPDVASHAVPLALKHDLRGHEGHRAALAAAQRALRLRDGPLEVGELQHQRLPVRVPNGKVLRLYIAVANLGSQMYVRQGVDGLLDHGQAPMLWQWPFIVAFCLPGEQSLVQVLPSAQVHAHNDVRRSVVYLLQLNEVGMGPLALRKQLQHVELPPDELELMQAYHFGLVQNLRNQSIVLPSAILLCVAVRELQPAHAAKEALADLGADVEPVDAPQLT